ncbi:MAG: hypothetical protein ABIG32_02760 [Candidatus Uhrbacteria bacterium]|nr:hypothetical protein [Patescibacteria group bacterium]MBU1907085.1 hypothetical protein [Patescibacteria group bacterium]
MPAGLSPKEERMAQEVISTAQSQARVSAMRGFEAAQISSASQNQQAQASSAAEQEMIQKQTLAAQLSQAVRSEAQRALAQQEFDTMAAQAAEETTGAIQATSGEEQSLIAQQAYKAAKKKIEFLQQQISDRLENLAESTGESFVLSGMIYIVLAIWVVVRVLRTILIKSEKGFMGLFATLIPPYNLGQMLLAAVVVIFGLILMFAIFGLAVVILVTVLDATSGVINLVPAPFRDLLLKAFGSVAL